MATAEAIRPATEVREIPLDLVHPRLDQPRQHFGESDLDTLAQSIRTEGVLTPLQVRPDGNGGYDLLAGHRRRLASIRAGLTTVPCIISERDDRSALRLVVADNLAREDLLPWEEGAGYRALLHVGESPEEVADLAGRSRDYVLDRVLISTLPSDITDRYRHGQISSVKLLVEIAKLPMDPVPDTAPDNPADAPQALLMDPPQVDLRRVAAKEVSGHSYNTGARMIASRRAQHALPGGAQQERMALEIERVPTRTVEARAGLDRRLSELSRFREWAVENADDLGHLPRERRQAVAQQIEAARAALDDIERAVRV